VMMYPNPVSKGQKLYFTSKVSIEIYNYLGQLINTKEDVYHLETHRFSKGVYIVRFEDTMCQKLIIK